MILELIIICALSLLIYMIVCFFVSLLSRRNDVADVAWGLGFVVVALVMLFYKGNGDNEKFSLMFILTLLWGARLAIHIFFRNKKRGEDPRYKKWRKEWGRWFIIRSFFQVYLLQGSLILIISLPLIITAGLKETFLSALSFVGLAVWLLGFFFEAVGDWQLNNFIKKKENRGKIIQSGLWRYTRHPNYFGEVTMWWGVFLISVSGNLFSLLGIIGPITITCLIFFVSGIPMLEKAFEGRGDWEVYKKKTSVFFPLPPKN